MKIFFLSLISIFFLTVPTGLVLAQNKVDSQLTECEDLISKFEQAGAGDLAKSLPAYCTPGSVFNKITTVLYTIAGIVAVIAFIYGGYVYMTAGSNDEAKKRGRQILTYTVVGLVIVLLAAVIVTIISKFVVDNTLF